MFSKILEAFNHHETNDRQRVLLSSAVYSSDGSLSYNRDRAGNLSNKQSCFVARIRRCRRHAFVFQPAQEQQEQRTTVGIHVCCGRWGPLEVTENPLLADPQNGDLTCGGWTRGYDVDIPLLHPGQLRMPRHEIRCQNIHQNMAEIGRVS